MRSLCRSQDVSTREAPGLSTASLNIPGKAGALQDSTHPPFPFPFSLPPELFIPNAIFISLQLLGGKLRVSIWAATEKNIRKLPGMY